MAQATWEKPADAALPGAKPTFSPERLKFFIGGLLILGGLTFVVLSARDFFGSLTVNEDGYELKTGFGTRRGEWKDVAKWTVNDAETAPFCVQALLRDNSAALVLGGGYLSSQQCKHVRSLLQAFAAK